MTSIVKETSPHLRRKDTLWGMMLDVIIALTPAIVFSFVIYGLHALYIYLISIPTMLILEFLYVLLKNRMPPDYTRKVPFKERFAYAIKHYTINNLLAPLVSALIYSLITNPGAPLYAVFIGAVFGLLVGKLLFGGTGSNIFNPAAFGMVFAKLCFGSQYVEVTSPFFDVASGGTALTGLSNSIHSYTAYSLTDSFLGLVPGTIGETSALCLLIGLVYLLIRRVADWKVVLSYGLSFASFILIFALCAYGLYNDISIWRLFLYELLSGGFLFGLTFMMTDPVTMPITTPGRVMYGVLSAALAVIIRTMGALPEGVGFAILLSNMCVPLIDYHKWCSNAWNYKKVLWIAGIFVLAGVIIVLGTLYGGKVNA